MTSRVAFLAGNDGLLKRGLKFTPTPKSNTTELQADVKAFTRRLRLKENFYQDSDTDSDSNSDSDSEPIVRNKSSWTPKPKRNVLLDSCINSLHLSTKEFSETSRQNCKSNITKAEQKALKELQNNDDIVIKKADKGGAVCIMNKCFYVEKIHELLNDRETYKEIEEKQLNTARLNINKLINEHKSCKC